MAVAAFIVSLVSLAISFATIAWNIYTWRHNGAHLKIELKVKNAERRGKMIDVLSIDIKNAGRLVTEIYSLDLPQKESGQSLDGEIANHPRDPDGYYPFPCELTPGQIVSMKYSVKYLARFVHALELEPGKLRLRLRTGHKDHVKRLPKDLVTELERQVNEREAEQGG
ncbi:hypothetical protein [uncultured Corynebacterium sp.]|uniref:hypothetical protein n=1 Tax=uncultured Corynebacterium sp. TaxID=159447 RepID=UPI00259252C4|nr:hypothetical protein [uncultured Corynebacterium sp.]